MHFEYILYVLTEFYCLIFAFTILFQLDSSMGSEHEVRQLRNIIYSYFGLIISDIFWASVKYKVIHPFSLVNLLGNLIEYIFVALTCYFWCRYIENKIYPEKAYKKSYNILMMIPIVTLLILDVLSIFTGWIIYIDSEGQCQTGPLVWTHWFVDFFYVLIPTFAAIIKSFGAKTKHQKKMYMRYSMYLFILIPGVIQAFIPGTPIFALNEFMVINVLFLTVQSMQIYDDALTGLNNRRRLVKYLDERLKNASEDRPIIFFIMDINRFKMINDIYGHLEGDNALRSFADILRKISVNHNAFIARYAGDEFCLVIDGENIDPEEVIRDLNTMLQDTRKMPEGRKKGYVISASCGYFACKTPEPDVDVVIEKADKMLYERKRKWHRDNITLRQN